MLTKVQKLSGLPANTNAPLVTFSPDHKERHTEGTVIEFEHTRAPRWIGNFIPASKRVATDLLFIEESRTALIPSGPYLYAVKEPRKIYKTWDGYSDWLYLKKSPDCKFYVAASMGGRVVVMDSELKTYLDENLDPCEDIRITNIPLCRIEGEYFDVSQNQWKEFSLRWSA